MAPRRGFSSPETGGALEGELVCANKTPQDNNNTAMHFIAREFYTFHKIAVTIPLARQATA
jgi:hypothetical protein